jgi:hypothetical protein
LLAHGRWFSPGTPACSTTKTDRHEIAEILLRVALNTKNHIKSSAVDHGLEPRSGQTEDYKICICCFFVKQAALRRKSKDWLAQNQVNCVRVGRHVYPRTGLMRGGLAGTSVQDPESKEEARESLKSTIVLAIDVLF